METENTAIAEITERIESPLERRRGLCIVAATAYLVLSYLFVSLVPINVAPLGFLVWTIATWSATAVFCLLNGGKLGFHSVCAALFCLAAALFRFIRGHVTADVFPVLLLCTLAYLYFVVTLFDNHSRSFGGGFLLDVIKGIAYPFISFHAFFVTLFKKSEDKRRSKNIWMAVIGVAAAFIAVLIVAGLLSYDANFAKLLPKIEIDSVGEIVFKLGFAIPLAALIFGAGVSSLTKRLDKLSSRETVGSVGKKVKVIPALIVILPVFALLAVYVLFFISQFAYYVGAFTHNLPEGYSMAEYAREGFFQLCGVVCINGALLAVLRCFTKTSAGGEALCRVLSFLLSLFTLILIATAVSKMLLYIESYDLTRLRLAVTVFLIFLAVAFTLTLLASVIKGFKAMPVIIVAGAVFIAVFALVNTNSLISKYNTEAYLGGRHETIDVEYLASDLGYSSLPELLKLRDNAPDAEIRSKAADGIRSISNRMNEDGNKWYNCSVPYLRAKKLLGGSGSSVPSI